MKNFKKFGSLFLILGLLLVGGGASTVEAAAGEGTATINGGASVTVEISSSTTFTVVLTVGASGIAAADNSPTFTVPTGFTAPDAGGVVAVEGVDAAGEWFAEGAGDTCSVDMDTSGAAGQVITVDLDGACAAADTITLTYQGEAPATASAGLEFDVATDDDDQDAVVGIAVPPEVIVKGTAVVANHETAAVATTNNLAGTDLAGDTDVVLGGFSITATGEDVDVTAVRLTVALTGMVIGELTDLRIVADDGTGDGDADDGVMHADELAAAIDTVAEPIVGNNAFDVTGETVAEDATVNYFIVGTLADTVTHGDTIDVEATGAGSVSEGATSEVAITLTGTSTNSTRTVTDTTAPEAPTADPDEGTYRGVQEITFTSTGSTVIRHTNDGSTPTCSSGSTANPYSIFGSRTIKVIGCDDADNASAVATFEYTITSSSGGGGSKKSNTPATPAVPSPAPSDCLPGYLFSPSTGKNCNAATPATPASPGTGGYAFGLGLVKQGTTGEACMAWQMFLNTKGNAGLALDGKCGPLTMAAARAWQGANGLVADGLLGPASRAKAMMQ